MVKTVTVQNFEEVVQSEKTVLLDFWATWCASMYASGAYRGSTGRRRLCSRQGRCGCTAGTGTEIPDYEYSYIDRF